MEPSVLKLIHQIARAQTFEAAADEVLGACLDVAEATLAASGANGWGLPTTTSSSVPNPRFADQEVGGPTRILRAMVHFRPDDGYVRLVAQDVDPDGKRTQTNVTNGANVSSATAWRWVKQDGAPVAIDMVYCAITRMAGLVRGEPPMTERFDAARSTAILVDRNVTHLFVVPLRAPGGRIDGMITVEAQCRAAAGTPFIWETVAPVLETMAATAAPYLARLPVTRVEVTTPDEHLPVIGASMQGVVEMLRVFARQEETILLSGPTGAGKSRLARWCHERSPVRGKPFEVIDLAMVPEDLQMGELFGWRKGAFTGAARETQGSVARAEGGTLFIDEIDKLSLKAQSGLLRVLEEKRYRMLGDGSGDRSANVRFIIGTNADLFALTQKGAFREDLYYRINVLPVRIPALCDRRDEIVRWATYMLQRRHKSNGDSGEAAMSREAARAFESHDWPGNLRQLDNIVRRAYALSLVDRSDDADAVVLSEYHVERALEHEGKGPRRSVWEMMERAAEAFVNEAERVQSHNHAKLDLDLADSFRALVLDTAKRRGGSDEKEAIRRAFVLLNKEATVESRNHSAAYKREMESLQKAKSILSHGSSGNGSNGTKA